MESLGKKLLANRKRLGLTQDQLAEKLGVTAQAISKWENDQSCPDITMLPKLCDLFGISSDQLLGREPEPPVLETEVVGSESSSRCRFKFNGIDNLDQAQKKLEKTSLWTAVLVLAVGLIYLLDALLGWKLGFGTVLWTTALTVYGLRGLWPRFRFFRLGCLVVGLYSLVSRIVTLPFTLSHQIIVAGAIVLFGLSLLADVFRPGKEPVFSVTYTSPDGTRHQGKNVNEYDVEPDGFSYVGCFSSNRQRVDLEKLHSGSVDVSFGEFTVDLSGIEHLAEDAQLSTECRFGELTVLVPRRFRVKPVPETTFAQFQMEGEPSPDASEVLTVESQCSFGETVVRYL